MNYRKSNHSFSLPPLKRIVYFLTLSGFANSALANGFPVTPLHLQNEVTTVSPAGVKPNIMLFIDDSGSMAWNLHNNVAPQSIGADTRMFVVQKALNDVLNKYTNQMNWGIQTLHNNRRGTLSTERTHRDATLKGWFGLAPSNTMSCQSGTYAITSANYTNPASMTATDNQRLNFTDNHETIRRHLACLSPNGGTPTTTRYNAITKLMHEQSNNLKNRCQKSYIVVLSDGDADGGQGALSTSSSNVFKDLKTSGKDNFGVSWEDPLHKVQNIVTYTVGFGSGLSPAGRAYLTDGASECKGPDCLTPKHFYNATQSADLVNAFDKIFTDISSNNKAVDQEVFSATAPAISSNYIDGMAAAATLHTGSWSSELVFYDIDAKGELDMSKPMRPSFKNRQLLISDGKDVHLYSQALTNGTGTATKTNNWFNIPNVNTNSPDNNTNLNRSEWRDGLLKWMARADTDENIANQITGASKFQLQYRQRPIADAAKNIIDQRAMGDIIDNSILAVGDFDSTTKRQEFVVTSTNDGMVYVFQAQNDATHPYALKFNYAPAKMDRASNDGSDYVGKYYQKPTLKDYGSDSKTNPHYYLLNGGMVARTTSAGPFGKQVFAASTMGQAGRGAFAFNIGGVKRDTGKNVGVDAMTANNWHQDVKLFETETGATNTLGYTIGMPQIGRIQIQANSTATENSVTNGVHYGVFVSNGYNYSTNYAAATPIYNDTPALYIYDGLGQDTGLTPGTSQYKSGDLLKKITVTSGVGGLATPTLVDVNFDGVIDYAYAGDYGGGLYRFNLKSPNPDSWTATKIFQTANNRPITTAPAVYRNSDSKYTVMVGTGSEIYQQDLKLTNEVNAKESLYGVFDDLTVVPATPATVSDMLQQTLSTDSLSVTSNNVTSSVEVRKSTNHDIEDHHKGWYIPLDTQNGERITTKPSVMGNTLLLSSRIYSKDQSSTGTGTQDPCVQQVSSSKSEAYSWLMQFNTSNGGLIPYNKNSVFIDFGFGEQAKFTSQSLGTQPYVITGQKLNSLTSITLIDRMIEGYSHSTSGDAGGSGEDTILTENPTVPRNNCVGEGSKAFTFDTDGQSKTYEIFGACQNNQFGYKRLSWREIF